jgi:hypothetical protein
VVVLCRRDLHLKAQADEPYDWQAGGESRFDRIVMTLNEGFEAGSVFVTGVSADAVGGFSLSLSGGLCLSVVPDNSDGSDYSEDYRIFQPDRDCSHFVVPERTNQ